MALTVKMRLVEKTGLEKMRWGDGFFLEATEYLGSGWFGGYRRFEAQVTSGTATHLIRTGTELVCRVWSMDVYLSRGGQKMDFVRPFITLVWCRERSDAFRC